MNLLSFSLIVINYFSEKLKLWVPTTVLDASPIRKLLDRGNKIYVTRQAKRDLQGDDVIM